VDWARVGRAKDWPSAERSERNERSERIERIECIERIEQAQPSTRVRVNRAVHCHARGRVQRRKRTPGKRQPPRATRARRNWMGRRPPLRVRQKRHGLERYEAAMKAAAHAAAVDGPAPTVELRSACVRSPRSPRSSTRTSSKSTRFYWRPRTSFWSCPPCGAPSMTASDSCRSRRVQRAPSAASAERSERRAQRAPSAASAERSERRAQRAQRAPSGGRHREPKVDSVREVLHQVAHQDALAHAAAADGEDDAVGLHRGPWRVGPHARAAATPP